MESGIVLNLCNTNFKNKFPHSDFHKIDCRIRYYSDYEYIWNLDKHLHMKKCKDIVSYVEEILSTTVVTDCDNTLYVFLQDIEYLLALCYEYPNYEIMVNLS